MKPIVILLSTLVFSLIVTSCKLQPAETELLIDPGTSISDVPVEFSLHTSIADGRMVFVGVGGEIEGVINPDLIVQPGKAVHLIITNKDGIPHDLLIPDLNIHVPLVSGNGATTGVNFAIRENQIGTYSYFCTVSGHRQAGMEGMLIVIEP